ncbi:hypothetical protein [Flavobacterium sp. GNP001]
MEFSGLEIRSENRFNYTTNGKQITNRISRFKKGKNNADFSLCWPSQSKPCILLAQKQKTMCKSGRRGKEKTPVNWLPSFDDVNEKVIFSLEIVEYDSKTIR